MSHYSVMVLGGNPEDQLAPFDENTEVLESNSLVFADRTAEYEDDFCNLVLEAWQLPSGKILLSPEDISATSAFALTGPPPPDAFKVSVFPDKVFPDLDSFVHDYHQQARHPENDKYGYFYNPQAKWDWYQLGGRWTGFFKLKKKRHGLTGEAGIVTSPPKQGYVDQALKGDIDFDGMRQHNETEAGQVYDAAMQIIGHLPPNIPWIEIQREYKNENCLDAAHQIYWSQPRCQAWSKQHGERSTSPDGYLQEREAFIRAAGVRSWTTFALLNHGDWHEQGHMGWFGVATDEADESEWALVISQALDKISDTTLVSIYDCHI